ncbi:MAG TPA: adenylate/guanylate cyclase domain-containing protein [Bdellovibrionota bacterium]|nr:adenylate/guanylate cyclase domain-containing protein [Bdellovibrionota bacterium]
MSQGKPKAAFLILEGRDAGRVISVKKLPFTIGRLLDNDLVLADEQVSRQHARLEMESGGLILADLRSRNGLFVNDRRIERTLLSVGDRVRIGSTVLVFQTDASKAREIMAESIPDSPAFALEEENEISHEEPTSVRHLSGLGAIESQTFQKAASQAAKLFFTALPPQDVASQLVDILFQAFSPDRVEVLWSAGEQLSIARSRKEGKRCPSFQMPDEMLKKAGRGAIAVRAAVPSPLRKSAEERSVLLAPLMADGEVKGWLYGDRSLEQTPFEGRDLETFQTMAWLASGVMERSTVLKENRKLKESISLMEKHLSPEVVRMLSAKGISIDESALAVDEREVTVLFSDIQGFTPLSERLKPNELAQLLNEYFQRMVDVIMVHHGTLNKFIGDAIMALFGAPESHGNDAANAVQAGFAMIETLKRFWEKIDERKRFNIRVGINTGRVVAGNIGSEKKMEYTVLGDAVNVASRLEGVSPPNVVTIGSRTAELVEGLFRLEKVSGVKVKGKSGEMEVFRVLGPATP